MPALCADPRLHSRGSSRGHGAIPHGAREPHEDAAGAGVGEGEGDVMTVAALFMLAWISGAMVGFSFGVTISKRGDR